jgi:hypothetical protein
LCRRSIKKGFFLFFLTSKFVASHSIQISSINMSGFALSAQHALLGSAARLPGPSGGRRTSAVRTRRAARFTTAVTVRASADSSGGGDGEQQRQQQERHSARADGGEAHTHTLSVQLQSEEQQQHADVAVAEESAAVEEAVAVAAEATLSVADLAAPVLASHGSSSSSIAAGRVALFTTSFATPIDDSRYGPRNHLTTPGSELPLQSKHGSIDDSQYGPCNLSDTPGVTTLIPGVEGVVEDTIAQTSTAVVAVATAPAPTPPKSLAASIPIPVLGAAALVAAGLGVKGILDRPSRAWTEGPGGGKVGTVGRVVTPGCQIGCVDHTACYVDHTACHQLVLFTIRPTRVVIPACQMVTYMDHTGCHRLVF